ncbi:kinase-like protein [Ophiobolus disseminans]|uniref:Kinase-like protein n=1 Tax=Ophiobolus disseminans TaxID=1469910 RepID=A0A6A7A3Y2_9PLEO|nr:kinase-like protein [Ophiobolus disseminans]
MAALNYPSCERARERLVGQQVTTCSNHLPRACPTSYFPRSRIVKVLTDFPVQDIFTCDCQRCQRHADALTGGDYRKKGVEENELLGPYATIYGLLIFLGYPGLISIFQGYRITLENGYLNEGNLSCLDQCRTITPGQRLIIRDEILEAQYRFHVQDFLARKTVTTIGEKEVFPIQEDDVPIGKGDFGEVYAFKFPDEYVDVSLRSRQIGKYARKIFDRRWTADTAKEWVNHLYANGLQHPNLMEALAAFEHGSYFFIVYELAQCTLWNFLSGTGGVDYTSQELWTQAQGLSNGLAYLHGQVVTGGRRENERMYHLDLKPSNILIVDKIMKIADFGLSDYKPDPRLTESVLVGDSRREAVKVYGPPAGRVSDRYDVYSLGAIFSEIASYDIGNETRVVEYRDRRKRNTPEGYENDVSMQFFCPKDFTLKRSVVEEHLQILEIVEESKDLSSETSLQSWQENFYHTDLFDMIKEMLHETATERPAAVEVATRLDSRIRQASRAIRGSLPYKLDIWDSTIKGNVPVDDDPEPPELQNRLRAFVGESRYGLWLYPTPDEGPVRLRRFVFDRMLKELEVKVVRERRQGVKPLYLAGAEHYPLSLVHAKGEAPMTYRFATLPEALRFQGIMTGEYIYHNLSIKLLHFEFLERKSEFRLYGQTKRYKYIEQVAIREPAHLQFWTPHEVKIGQVSSVPLDLKLALLTEERLYLIQVTKQFQSQSDMKASEQARMIRFAKADILTFQTSNGIPLTFKVPQRYRNNDRSRPHDSRHDEVRLHVRNETDVVTFWQTIETLREYLPDSLPRGVSHTQDIG